MHVQGSPRFFLRCSLCRQISKVPGRLRRIERARSSFAAACRSLRARWTPELRARRLSHARRKR